MVRGITIFKVIFWQGQKSQSHLKNLEWLAELRGYACDSKSCKNWGKNSATRVINSSR